MHDIKKYNFQKVVSISDPKKSPKVFAPDELDLKILAELQKDSEKTVKSIGAAVKAPFTTVHLRKKQLEKQKVILGYKAVVDKAKINQKVNALVFVKVSAKKNIAMITDRMKKLPYFKDVLVLSGEFQVFASVRAANLENLRHILYNPKDGLQSWDGITEFSTYICLDEIKRDGFEIKK